MGTPSIRHLCQTFIEAAEPALIPSPLEVCARTVMLALDYKDACREYTKQVRKEQERFQGNLESLGIERIMRMKHRDVVEFCRRY
jgi:hypothetical protein